MIKSLYALHMIVFAFFCVPRYSLLSNAMISNGLFSECYKKNAIDTVVTNFVSPPDYVYNISTKKWLTDDLDYRVRTQNNIQNCVLCDSKEMRQREKNGKWRVGNSTPRDVILTVMMRYSYNLETFIRSLRSTGCKAKVVIFHDEKSIESLNSYMFELIEKCGITLINIGTIKPKYVSNPYEVRHPWYYTFLLHYKNDFDRIIITDLVDVFFQTDPFTEDFTNQTLQTTTELVTLDKCPLNKEWISKADPLYDPVFYKGRICLCFGLLYGSMNAMLTLYDTLFRTKEWGKFEFQTVDQGYLNYFFYRGKFANRGLHLTATLPNDLIISARGGAPSNVNDSDTGFVMMDNTVVIPAMIHHYNRICPFINNIKNVCPSKNTNKEYAFAMPKETTC
jgi:hypothetical protein